MSYAFLFLKSILHVLYFYIFYIFLWLPSVVELNVGYNYIPNIKSVSHRTSKKSPDNLKFEQKIQVQGPYLSHKSFDRNEIRT
jgi:hypothetical protein